MSAGIQAAKGAGCKPVTETHRRFESSPAHSRRRPVLTLAQAHAIIEADRGAPIHWHVPVPRAGVGVLLATWAPLGIVVALLVMMLVRK